MPTPVAPATVVARPARSTTSVRRVPVEPPAAALPRARGPLRVAPLPSVAVALARPPVVPTRGTVVTARGTVAATRTLVATGVPAAVLAARAVGTVLAARTAPGSIPTGAVTSVAGAVTTVRVRATAVGSTVVATVALRTAALGTVRTRASTVGSVPVAALRAPAPVARAALVTAAATVTRRVTAGRPAMSPATLVAGASSTVLVASTAAVVARPRTVRLGLVGAVVHEGSLSFWSLRRPSSHASVLGHAAGRL
ncbi:hypothetical protein [Cellulosimicrobium composti]|uniref:hypothetical protein n=1 Tax=Cellulosimicrobium composti TaxID=2672572 RepID=UPI00138FBE2B|nr:hypothetical protein [Cellulosimicrobium composti]